MYELIIAVKIKTSMLFNYLVYAKSTTLLLLFLHFLIIDLYFLIPAVIVQTCNPIPELIIPIGIPAKQAKVGIEIHQVISGTKIRNYSI